MGKLFDNFLYPTGKFFKKYFMYLFINYGSNHSRGSHVIVRPGAPKMLNSPLLLAENCIHEKTRKSSFTSLSTWNSLSRRQMAHYVNRRASVDPTMHEEECSELSCLDGLLRTEPGTRLRWKKKREESNAGENLWNVRETVLFHYVHVTRELLRRVCFVCLFVWTAF